MEVRATLVSLTRKSISKRLSIKYEVIAIILSGYPDWHISLPMQVMPLTVLKVKILVLLFIAIRVGMAVMRNRIVVKESVRLQEEDMKPFSVDGMRR